MIKIKESVYEEELQPSLSPDVAAMKRIVTALSAMVKRAQKPAALAKEERDLRKQAILLDYQTEDDINDAYGYASITEEERSILLDCLNGKKNPKRQELSESEIYLLELQDLLTHASKRLHILEWDELSSEEKERVSNRSEEYKEYLRKIKTDFIGLISPE